MIATGSAEVAMTSEHVLVFWPLSGVKLQARVLNEETVWLT
jgi:hypothetical protein